jgi:hypothetical protein
MNVDATLQTLRDRSPAQQDTKEALSDDVRDPEVDAELVDTAAR